MTRLLSPAPIFRPAVLALLLAGALVTIGIVALVLFQFAAPDQKPAPGERSVAAADPVVLKINAIAVNRSEIIELQASLGAEAAKVPLGEFFDTVADEVIATKLLSEAARAAKLEDDPDFQADFARAKEEIVSGVYVSRIEAAASTDEALKALYDRTASTDGGKPEIKARHILVKTEEEAKAIIAELDKGGDFAALARDHSTDEDGKQEGGDLGWFDKDVMVPEFSEAAFKLAKGEYTKVPVKTSFGFHVIKVDDLRVAPPPSFDEAKDNLKSQLINQAVEAKIDELRAAAKIEQFSIDGGPFVPLPDPLPPGHPGH